MLLQAKGLACTAAQQYNHCSYTIVKCLVQLIYFYVYDDNFSYNDDFN